MAEPNDEDAMEEDSPDPPHRLEYRSPRQDRQDRPAPSMGGQIGMGFVAWLGTVTVLAAVLWQGGASDTVNYLLVALALGLLLTLCVYIRMQYKWRGFIPGVLLGSGVTCLLPLGLLAILCGGHF